MTFSRPLFIVLEGLDGSGKSTCAKALASHLGASFLTTPSPAVREFREPLIESFKGCQEANQLFYLATVFHASDEVRRLLAQGRWVVMDRYLLSTQAYAAFRGTRLELDDIGDLLVPPDVTVFLDVPLEIRRTRLLHRGTSPADRETLSEEADRRLRDEYARRAHLGIAGQFLHLEGGNLTPDQVFQRSLGGITERMSAFG